MERGIIQIKCTSEQRECIIDALAKYEYCIFNQKENMCHPTNVPGGISINCKKCLKRTIDWEIKGE